MYFLDKFITLNEKVFKTIDDQQEIIDTIDDMFSLSYNIKDKTVDSVENLIRDSK